MKGGYEVPILETDRANGRHRFRVAQGGHYGTRRLRVTVKHEYASRQAAHVDRYRVRPPRRLRAPKRVRARRYLHDVHVRWSGVRAARGYLVEVSRGRRGRPKEVSYVRRVSARRRRMVFRSTAGGGRLVARVYALNSDDKLGRSKAQAFATGPSARTLRAAARRSAHSARRSGGAVGLVSHCPQDRGHCQAVVELRRRGRVVGRLAFQQPPDTFRPVRIRPAGPRLRRLLRQKKARLSVVVRLRRGRERTSSRDST
jgi:hypothetical protein